MPTPPLHRRLTSDGVASTCRMHRVNRDIVGVARRVPPPLVSKGGSCFRCETRQTGRFDGPERNADLRTIRTIASPLREPVRHEPLSLPKQANALLPVARNLALRNQQDLRPAVKMHVSAGRGD